VRDTLSLYEIAKAGPARQRKMRCPQCVTQTLHEFLARGVTVDRCSACSGIWFDAQELSQLLAEEARHVASLLRGNPAAEAGGKSRFCPRENAKLLRVYSAINRSVIVDACPQCGGIWLDGGEFEKLFAAR
jgi:Zn-finger nucleic acid-binding protein